MRKTLMIVVAVLAVALLGAIPANAGKLTLGKAKAAAQKTADEFAGRPTTINVLLKISDREYYAQAQWEVPATPFNQSCFAELTVKQPKGKLKAKARIDSFACF